MLKEALAQIKTAVVFLFVLTVLTGFFYPVIVTGIAQVLFPEQANGSLIKLNDKAVGSRLIGQPFSSSAYFWSRPSATNLYPYNGAASSGSNLGPSNPQLVALVKERIQQLTLDQNEQLIPVDLVTASGSGLDPEISPYAVFYQVPRIAKARGFAQETVYALIRQHTQSRTWGILGEPRVNVLMLNLALDRLSMNHD